MADTLDIGTLSGRIELEDKLGPQVAEIANKLDLLNDKMSQSHGHAGEVAEGMLTAEAAMKVAEFALDAVKEGFEKLWDIALEGSHAADIEDTFHRMTAAAGLAADKLKGDMTAALHGTVDDEDLMVRVNQNLAAGLTLTSDQIGVLSKGAYALAKATGGDAKEALDKLSDAMVTGRTRSIALLTGKIDLSAAEDIFAAKLGTTADRLSAEGKQAAAQEIILRKVEEATARVGDQKERLADKVKAAQVEFHNFQEEVGIAIATSPVLTAGFDAIKDAISEAFGSDKTALVKTVAQTVDDLAIGVLGLAEYVVDAVGVIGVEWNAAIVVMDMVKAGWAAIAYVAEGALLVIEKGINAVSFGALDEQVKTLEADMDGWYNTMAESQAGIDAHKKSEDEWAVSTGKVKDKIEEVRQKMIAAKDTTHDYTEPIRDVTEAHHEAGEAADSHGASEKKVGLILGQTKDEAKKYADAIKEIAFVSGDWKNVLDGISGDTVNAVKFYLDAGVGLDKLAAAYDLTNTQAKAIEKSWKMGNDTIKETLKAIDELTKGWNTYYKELADLNESDVKKTKTSALEKYDALVEKLQEAGATDAKYYDDAWKLYEADVKKNEQALILKDQNSKAYISKQLNDARDLYQFMLDHSDQYTREERDNQAKIIEALKATREHWGNVGHAIDANVEKVRTLSGEVLTLKEYEARQLSGGSYQYDLTTRAGVETYRQMNPGMQVNWNDEQIIDFAKKGGTLAQLMQMGIISMKPYHSFEGGGVGEFGSGTLAMLHGHEAIVPLGNGGPGLGTSVQITQFINGTAADVARQVSEEIMRTLKSIRQFGSA